MTLRTTIGHYYRTLQVDTSFFFVLRYVGLLIYVKYEEKKKQTEFIGMCTSFW